MLCADMTAAGLGWGREVGVKTNSARLGAECARPRVVLESSVSDRRDVGLDSRMTRAMTTQLVTHDGHTRLGLGKLPAQSGDLDIDARRDRGITCVA